MAARQLVRRAHVEHGDEAGLTPLAQLTAVSNASHPTWRVRSLSVYRFWRDLGYALGALAAGVIADLFGLAWAIASIAGLTFFSGVVVAAAMQRPVTPVNSEPGAPGHAQAATLDAR